MNWSFSSDDVTDDITYLYFLCSKLTTRLKLLTLRLVQYERHAAWITHAAVCLRSLLSYMNEQWGVYTLGVQSERHKDSCWWSQRKTHLRQIPSYVAVSFGLHQPDQLIQVLIKTLASPVFVKKVVQTFNA